MSLLSLNGYSIKLVTSADKATWPYLGFEARYEDTLNATPCSIGLSNVRLSGPFLLHSTFSTMSSKVSKSVSAMIDRNHSKIVWRGRVSSGKRTLSIQSNSFYSTFLQTLWVSSFECLPSFLVYNCHCFSKQPVFGVNLSSHCHGMVAFPGWKGPFRCRCKCLQFTLVLKMHSTAPWCLPMCQVCLFLFFRKLAQAHLSGPVQNVVHKWYLLILVM